MEYPKHFVDKVKRLYPDWPHLHHLLDIGSESVYRNLKEVEVRMSVPFGRVMRANSLEELREFVQLEQERAKLADECFVIQEKLRAKRSAERWQKIEDAIKKGEPIPHL